MLTQSSCVRVYSILQPLVQCVESSGLHKWALMHGSGLLCVYRLHRCVFEDAPPYVGNGNGGRGASHGPGSGTTLN